MKTHTLSARSLKKLQKSISIPSYRMGKNPCTILHFGIGNFHRSHQAFYLHSLLQIADTDWRICGVGLMPGDALMKENLASQDYLYSLVMQGSHAEELSIIGSIDDLIVLPEEYDRLMSVSCSKELRIISLTVTEKGYCYDAEWDLDREHPDIKHDIAHPDQPVTVPGVLARCLKERFSSSDLPITIMSCDNIPENGKVLKKVLFSYLQLIGEQALLDTIERSVSFPCTMVDRITPATTDAQREYLKGTYGIIDVCPVFSEDFIQWVIEDDFKAGRPDWETVGAALTGDVVPYELMKIRLLNGSHSAISYLSLLAGYTYVDDAVTDSEIKAFLKSYLQEIRKTLKPIPAVDFEVYIESLIRRFSNIAIRDRLLRLAEDGSRKIPNAIIAPLNELLDTGKPTACITFSLAAWIVYLAQSVDNEAYKVEDPMSELLVTAAQTALEDVREFLGLAGLFPKELLEQEQFIAVLQQDIDRIVTRGIRAAMRKLLEL